MSRVALLLALVASVAVAQALPDPVALAHRAGVALGDPDAVTELAFTFVVRAQGQERVRRRHTWRPGEGTLRVASGEREVVLRNVHAHDLDRAARDPAAHAAVWRAVSPEASPEDAAGAWAAFINDAFWLYAPARMRAPGTSLSYEEGWLRVAYGDVGVTPGDRYDYRLDDEGRVTEWRYRLSSGRDGRWTWKEHRSFGPLTLSVLRESMDGDTVIAFEDVAVTP
ncbi:MAG: hypothetical protein AAGH15_15520 [Myxococcota bacterium]